MNQEATSLTGVSGAGQPSAATPSDPASPPSVLMFIPKTEPGICMSKKTKKSNRSTSAAGQTEENFLETSDLQDGDVTEIVPPPFLSRYQENHRLLSARDRKYPELKFPSETPYSNCFLTGEGLGRYKVIGGRCFNDMRFLPLDGNNIASTLQLLSTVVNMSEIQVPESMDEIVVTLSNCKANSWKMLTSWLFSLEITQLNKICCHNWMPKVNRFILKPERVTLLYMVAKALPFNFGKLIFDEIWRVRMLLRTPPLLSD
ncbi:unnamed protein product [Arabidopsis thaliana]|uniref:(thale cress) hypothetical protein n=1 Tax=Arabidopsis thaliana TaxID=3702 RepID=A0A7G2EU00_ARATH|nr:unnamed protein product [Arabidopsis thaliana]